MNYLNSKLVQMWRTIELKKVSARQLTFNRESCSSISRCLDLSSFLAVATLLDSTPGLDIILSFICRILPKKYLLEKCSLRSYDVEMCGSDFNKILLKPWRNKKEQMFIGMLQKYLSLFDSYFDYCLSNKHLETL